MHNSAHYSVTTYHGESATLYYVVWRNPEDPEDDWNIVATYAEKWRADRHAITGCGCAQNSTALERLADLPRARRKAR